MTQFKGTREKWYVDNVNIRINRYNVRCTSIRTKSDYGFAEVFGDNEIAEANAKLISKAPEMLAMLQYFIQHNMLSATGEVMAEQLIKEATTL